MNKIASIDAALTRCIQDMQMSLSIAAISMQTMTYDEMVASNARVVAAVAALGGPEVRKPYQALSNLLQWFRSTL